MSSGGEGFTVFHKEYVGDITGSTAFKTETFNLNPGLSGTFPWLAQIADAYEEYRVDGLIWSFKSNYSEYQPGAATGAMGTVMMATNYNANQQPFTDKRTMENYEYASSQNPTANQVHACNTRGSGTPVKTLWIRTGNPTEADFDLRLYDLGVFNIATQGQPADGTNLGELWVTYQITFFKPRYRTNGGKTDHYTLMKDTASPTLGNMAGTLDNTHPWGSGVSVINATSPPLTNTNRTNGIFGIGTYLEGDRGVANYQFLTFPKSTANQLYKVTFIWQSPTLPISTNCIGWQPLQLLGGATIVQNWRNQDFTGDSANAPTVNQVNPAGQGSSMFSVLIQMPAVINPSILPGVGFQHFNANCTPRSDPINIDLFVEEIDPRYYTKPY